MWRENNRNVVVVVEGRVGLECRVDVESMWGRC